MTSESVMSTTGRYEALVLCLECLSLSESLVSGTGTEVQSDKLK